MLRVLLVEDEQLDAEAIVRILTPWNAVTQDGFQFEITHEPNLTNALAQLGEANFDLILLDLDMPDSQGINTFDIMSAHAPHMPIVVLTGNEDQSIGLLAVKRGAQDYLVKREVTRHWVVKSLKYAIERKSLENQQLALTRELKKTLREVQALKGMLCVCAWCGKLKDESADQYISVTKFVQTHTDLSVSHGLCPDCQVRMQDDSHACEDNRQAAQDAPPSEHENAAQES